MPSCMWVCRSLLPEFVNVTQSGESLAHKLVKGTMKTAVVEVTEVNFLCSMWSCS